MIGISGNITAGEMYEHILQEKDRGRDPKEYTYVIFGMTGRTGKTWLADRLRENGFRVLELAEKVNHQVVYRMSDHNSLSVYNEEKLVVITLNRRI